MMNDCDAETVQKYEKSVIYFFIENAQCYLLTCTGVPIAREAIITLTPI